MIGARGKTGFSGGSQGRTVTLTRIEIGSEVWPVSSATDAVIVKSPALRLEVIVSLVASTPTWIPESEMAWIVGVPIQDPVKVISIASC